MPLETSPVEYQSSLNVAPTQEPSEDEVRDYAYHLYEQGNRAPGHDVENWLEALACLKAHIPEHASHSRLYRYASWIDSEKLRAKMAQS